jgi:hypothetical protein
MSPAANGAAETVPVDCRGTLSGKCPVFSSECIPVWTPLVNTSTAAKSRTIKGKTLSIAVTGGYGSRQAVCGIRDYLKSSGCHKRI